MNRMLISTLAVFFALTGAAAPAVSEDVVLISSHTREFVGVEAGVLAGVELETQALVVDRITLDGNKMAFRAKSGKFVRAGVGAQTLLAATSDHIRGWETFEIVPVTAAKFAIKSVQNGKYVSLRADGRLSASANAITSRETFSAREADAPVFDFPPIIIPGGDDLELAGSWRIHRIRTIDASLIPLPASIRGESFINIRDNGRMSASTGCNDIAGMARLEDDIVQFSNITATRRFCIGDAGTFELLLFVAFDHSRIVEGDNEELSFSDVNGDPVMILRRN
jgi:hypothetical protein